MSWCCSICRGRRARVPFTATARGLWIVCILPPHAARDAGCWSGNMGITVAAASWTCFRIPRTSNRSQCSNRPEGGHEPRSADGGSAWCGARTPGGSRLAPAGRWRDPICAITSPGHRRLTAIHAADGAAGRVDRRAIFARSAMAFAAAAGRVWTSSGPTVPRCCAAAGLMMASGSRAAGVDLHRALRRHDYGCSGHRDRALHRRAAAVGTAVADVRHARGRHGAVAALPGHGAVVADSRGAGPARVG